MLLGWTGLLLAAVAAGAAACVSLVAPRRAAAAAVASALGGFVLAAWCVVVLYRLGGRIDATVAACFIAVGALAGGFALAAALVPSVTRLPPAVAPVFGERSAAPWVVVVAEGQPERYHPSTVTQYFQRLADSEVPLPRESTRVFAYFSERERYHQAGLDPTRPVVREVTRRASAILAEKGFAGRVVEAWLHGRPRLSDALSDAVTHGARDIAIVLLDVAESYEFDLAVREAGALGLASAGVRLAYAAPLWADERLVHLVTDRVLRALPGGPRSSDGVVLAASGRPWQWDRTHPKESEHETFFCQRARAALVAAGLTEAHVRTAWLDWQDPDVTEAVRHLSAVGCERIVVAPATTPADSLDVAIELPAAVGQAALEPSIAVEVLHGWGDDEAVSDVLADAARVALGELGRDRDAQ